MSTATTHIETKKQLVPALRFNEFDKAWGKEKLLGHVNSISSGKIKPDKEGKYLVYGSTGVIGKSDEFTHEGDYLLIARVGANAGKINRVKGKYAVTDNTLIIDLKDSVDVAFCESFLIKFNLNRLIFGSGQPLITGGLLKSLDFIFPDYLEQQKIASFLSAVDEKIQQLTKKKALLEDYKKGVMQQLFSGQLRFKDENGKDYPDWEEKRLGEVSRFLDGRRKPIKGGDRSKIQGEYPYYGASGIIDYVNNYIFDEEIILLGEDGENIISRNLPLAFRVSGKCWINNHAHVIKPNDNTDIDFLTYSLERINYEPYNTGTAQPKLNQAVCRSLPLKLPSYPEQQKIATYLSGIDAKIAAVNTQITQTQTFKKGLLQQMFI